MNIVERKPIDLAIILLLLCAIGGCIGSPLPPGAVAGLYRWDDRQSAVATRTGQVLEEHDGYFSGDFDFGDVLDSYPELAETPDQPLLIKACEEELCYAVIVFGDFFQLNEEGRVTGYASMNSLTTAMANQVMALPAEEVLGALNILAGRLTAGGDADYQAFLRLDPERKPQHEALLLNDRVFAAAQRLVVEAPGFTVDKLLGESRIATEDLQVPDGFVFDDTYVLSVDIDVSAVLDEKAYLSICSEYSQTGSDYEINFDACQLSTPLVGGRYVGELNLTGSTTELLVVILPLQSPEDALYYPWSRQQSGDRLRI
ncbi:hypothetical protein EY643_02345 [Halioglobus maricola]|uniref:Uncharacterized protein n=1 Tax=Halioglobus maricola TaxID=2601894 RepID=A0A5P9NFK8_9GAMM|nr:hypothetical protein [Halioglobus maricola]QFU74583.1 hypothetical protein EY643_02345 [Halioglobus maricola]